MNSSGPHDSIDPGILAQIDSICDEFEGQYQQGQSPEIASFLAKTSELQQSTLFLELVRLDCHYRRSRGLAVSLFEYASRFPQYCSLLDSLAGELQAPSGPRVPLRFQLKSILGVGSYGTVWKAWDTTLGRIVAIKAPKHQEMSSSDARIFLNEAKAAARLAIPGVVRILDYGEHSDQVYLVYEFIDGKTLKDTLAAGRLTTTESVLLCIKICESLEQIHAAGVIHRDLKPGNIMIDVEGQPQILDFGLARRVDSESTLAQSGVILGSLAYMSPEQAQGRSTGVDHRSDIYSLGAILYELLVGQPVFRGTAPQVLHQILHDRPAGLTRINAEIPAALVTICLRSLEKAATDRYQTAKEFADDLRRYLNTQPIKARRISAFEKCRRWARRHPKQSGCLTLMAIVIASVSMYWMYLARQELVRTHQLVSVSTDPPGAKIVLFPIGHRDGTPELSRRVEIGKSPATAWLRPGDYLVVAYRDPRTFHEVYRHIPDQREVKGQPFNFAHQRWKVEAARVVLPTVKLWDQANFEGKMASIPGGEFLMGGPEQESETPSHACRLTSYLLDASETSVHDYEVVTGYKWDAVSRCPDHSLQPSFAAACLSFDEVVAFAEKVGKRLPTEAEFEFVARHGSVPDQRSTIAYGAVTESPADQIENIADRPLWGLNSNVAEWTQSWYVPYPRIDGELPISGDAERFRSVRGGNLRGIRAALPPMSDELEGPQKRLAVDKKTWLPGLGFRCARSSHPRLLETDFESHEAVDVRTNSSAVRQVTQ